MKRVSLILLCLLTAAVLFLSLPHSAAWLLRVDVLLIYGLLTAVSLTFGVVLADRLQLSSAHVVGMLAFLSLPFGLIGMMTWALGSGGVLAEVIRGVRERRFGSQTYRAPARWWRVIFTVARVTVPFYCAGIVYHAVGGTLPLNDLTPTSLLPLLIYSLLYVGLYIGIYLAEIWYGGQPLDGLRQMRAEVLIALFLPIPFALLGAGVYNNGSDVLFSVYITGFAALLITPYAISLTQRRLRTQLDNYRQLSSANQALYDSQRQRVAQFSALNEVLMRLNGTLSFDVVLETITDSALMLSGGSAVSVFMYWDDVKGALALVRSSGLSQRFTSDPPDPLMSQAASKGATAPIVPLIISDAAQSDQAAGLRDLLLDEGKRAWIELPLLVGGVLVGVLVLYFDQPHEFAPETIEVLRTFANQVAQALSNARLYAITDEALERRVGQLLALAAIGHELTATIDLKTICNLVLNHALDATRSTMGLMQLFDEHDQTELVVKRGYNAATLDDPMPYLTGVVGEVRRRGEPILISNAEADPQSARFALSAQSQLTVPVLQNNTLLGVILLQNPQPGAFSTEDIDFIMQLANQAVIALDNARLFRRTMEARDRLQLILNNVQEAIILLDSTGTITLANPRADLLGFKPEALLDKSVLTLMEENPNFAAVLGYTPQELTELARHLTGGVMPADEPTSYSLESRYLARQVIPITDDEMRGALLVFYDETERIHLAQTREDVSRMLIHDLRSPLTAVTTSLKLLNELTPKDSNLRPLVDSTSESGRRAIRKILQRVDSLLDVSRMESDFLALDVEPTPLMAVVQMAREELDPIAQEINVGITTDIPDDLPLLSIDSDKVERVLLNLIDNALKFSGDGTTVTIRAQHNGGHMLQIDVIDRGPGVPDDYKTRLFDRFVQVKDQKGKRRGSGLGLTFCRLVIENHGGRIWVSDNPAGGSIFSFTLPTLKEKDKTKEVLKA